MKLTSAIAALLLSAVTIGTFYLLRNYGPESAIQRFHTAALAGDQREIAKLTLQPPSSIAVQELEEAVRTMAKRGSRPEVAMVQRGPAEVIVAIAYHSTQFDVEIFWVVDRTRASRWLINAEKCYVQRPWDY